MSKQDRQGVRTPADVERKYNLGEKFNHIMLLLDAHKAAQEVIESEIDETRGDLEGMRSNFQEAIDEFWQTKAELEETANDVKADMEVTKQEMENTAQEMRESAQSMLDDVKAMEEHLNPLAEWTDGERSGIAGFVAKADENSVILGNLVKWTGETGSTALAAFKQEVYDNFATTTMLSAVETDTATAIAGIKQEASDTYARIEYITTLENDISSSLAGIRQEVSESFATIESVVQLENDTASAIAGVKQEASETYATIDSLAALDTKTINAMAGIKQEASETYAKVETLASFETRTTEAITALKQEANDTYARIDTVATFETSVNNSLAGIRQEAAETYATVTSLAALETKTTNAIAGIEQDVSETYATIEAVAALEKSTTQSIAGVISLAGDTYATIETLASFKTETTDTMAGIRQTADKAGASIEQMISAIGEDGEITSTSIVQAINDGKSSIKLNAEQINLSGYVTLENLANGTTTIDGACIKTGKINANVLDLSDYATIGSLEDGTTTIDGACIKTGKINANVLDLSDYATIGGLEDGTTTIDGACIKTGKIQCSYSDYFYSDEYGVEYDGASGTYFLNIATEIDSEDDNMIEAGFRPQDGMLDVIITFAVSEKGLLYARDANIEGTITANDGKIGGWDISPNTIQSSYIGNYVGEEYDGEYGTYFLDLNSKITSKEDNWIEASFYPQDGMLDPVTSFAVSGTGRLFARGADIEGTVTTKSGKVGTFDIVPDGLICEGATITDEGIKVYRDFILSGEEIFATDYVSVTAGKKGERTPSIIFSHSEYWDQEKEDEYVHFLTEISMSYEEEGLFYVKKQGGSIYALYFDETSGTVKFHKFYD